eukprot:COSAG02_NODE_18588_length_930_cov_2.250301_2_plen_229_part_00
MYRKLHINAVKDAASVSALAFKSDQTRWAIFTPGPAGRRLLPRTAQLARCAVWTVGSRADGLTSDALDAICAALCARTTGQALPVLTVETHLARNASGPVFVWALPLATWITQSCTVAAAVECTSNSTACSTQAGLTVLSWRAIDARSSVLLWLFSSYTGRTGHTISAELVVTQIGTPHTCSQVFARLFSGLTGDRFERAQLPVGVSVSFNQDSIRVLQVTRDTKCCG